MSSRSDADHLLQRLTALGDLARLRMLRLLDHEELSVGELAKALQLPQSTVSRHLKLLHEAGWVTKRAEGTASLYRLIEAELSEDARALWTVARSQIGGSSTLADDDERLREVLAERRTDSKAFFGRLGGEWDDLRRDLFGSEFTSAALLGLVQRDWVIADLGCGTGNASELLAPFVNRTIAVDREDAMLDAARKRLAGLDNVEFRPGELTDLPIEDATVDAAMIFLVMHHVEDPTQVVVEAARILKPAGVLLIVDMVRHDRTSYRHTMGHQHLGFDEAAIRTWADASGLTEVSYRRLRPDVDARGPGLFAATLTRPITP